jgi:glycerol-3-phosphate acyltransferase PlsY
MQFLNPALAVLAAYLIGSLSFAVIVSRLMGLNDPRTYGSNNPGATNVLRSGNKAAAVLTLLLDALKGYVPVLLVRLYGADLGLAWGAVALVGLAAFAGHVYPVFFKFEGGKGVATALGVLFGVDAYLGLATALTWLLVAVFFRYSSLAALVAAVLAPVYYAMGAVLVWPWHAGMGWALIAMSAMLVWRHKLNIQRLAAGQESKIGAKK